MRSEFIIYKLDLNEPTENDTKIAKKIDKSTQKTLKKTSKRRNKKDDFAQFFDAVITVNNNDEEEDENIDIENEIFDGEEEEENLDIDGEEEEEFSDNENGCYEEEFLEEVYIPDQDKTIIKKVGENDAAFIQENEQINEENNL